MTWLEEVTLETVIVHTTQNMSFKGLKQTVYDDSLVLREVRDMDDPNNTLLDGDLVIPRERVHFIQRVAGNGR